MARVARRSWIRRLRAGQTRQQTTSAEGLFTAAALPPGRYRIAIESEGFKRTARDAVIEAGTSDSIQVRLELQDIT
jgi:hypothetical protein